MHLYNHLLRHLHSKKIVTNSKDLEIIYIAIFKHYNVVLIDAVSIRQAILRSLAQVGEASATTLNIILLTLKISKAALVDLSRRFASSSGVLFKIFLEVVFDYVNKAAL